MFGGRGRGVMWEMSRLCSSQSGPEHVGHVSVGAVDPEDQGEGNGHEGPGDSLHACRQAATSRAGRLLQFFTGLQVVPGCELKKLVQEDDGQRDLQHHQPLRQVQRGDLEDDLEGGTEGRTKTVAWIDTDYVTVSTFSHLLHI